MHEIVSFTKDIEFKNMINKITSISLEHTLSSDDDSTIKGDFIVSGSYKMTAASQIENDFSYKIPVDIEVLDKYDLTNLVIDIDDFTYEVVDEDVLRVHIDLLLDKLELKENNEEEASDDDLLDDDLFLEVEDEVPLEVTRKEETEDSEERKEKEEKEEMREEKEEIKEEAKEEVQEGITTDREEKEVEDVAQKIGNDFREEQEKLEQVQEEVTLECDESPKAVEYVLEENSETPSLFSSFDNSNETYSTYSVYILREGDSLDSVINKYKTTKEKLEEYNDLSDLKVGMKIVVPSNKNE